MTRHRKDRTSTILTSPDCCSLRRMRRGRFLAGLLGVLMMAVMVDLGEATSPDLLWDTGPGVMNHPVGVIPTSAVSIPEDWPLSESGAITCFTCHSNIPGDGDVDAIALRDIEDLSARSIEFCMKCHNLYAGTDKLLSVPIEGSALCFSCHDMN